MTKKNETISKIAYMISDAIDAAMDGMAAAKIETLSPRELVATLIAFEVIAKDGIADVSDEFDIPESAVDAMRKAMTGIFSEMMEGANVEAEVKH